ncbi:MAG TPA: MerR family transcriptional regulator [Acidimicrobiia bacterium]|nr:MerR family transcriptional regulator [Acidimicrobiia bacterium]
MDLDEDARPDDQIYKASDVKAICGLSYRQLNDWEYRGVLPEYVDRGEGWRKYTLYEVFVITVLAELKKQFNTPTKKLKFIKDQLVRKGQGRLNALMFFVILGTSQWLLTDFEEVFVLQSEIEIKDMFQQGDFTTEDHAAYVLLNITPLIQKVGSLSIEEELPFDGALFKAFQARSEEENEVLKHVRNDEITKIEILKPDGTVDTIKATQKKSINSVLEELDFVRELIPQYSFQTITISIHDGIVARVEQATTEKIKKTKAK